MTGKALLGLALLLGACSADSGTPIACSAEQRCAPPSARLQWAAQLIPQNSAQRPGGGGELTPQEEPRLLFDDKGGAQARFTQAAILAGTVHDAFGAIVPRARVVATLPSAIAGQDPYTFETSTQAGDGTFSLHVPVPRKPREQPYRLWIGFDDPAQAERNPPQWQDEMVGADTLLTLTLRPEGAMSTIDGQLVDSLRSGGVAGWRVQIIDQHGQIISTTATTSDGEIATNRGFYRVLFDARLSQDAQLRIVVQPGPGMSDGPILTHVFDRPADAQYLHQDFTLPAARASLPFEFRVNGTGTSGAVMSVPGARVQAQAYLPDPRLDRNTRALYTVSGTTDRQGLVRLSLVPSMSGNENLAYTVIVSSPASSPFASAVLPVQIGPQPGQSTLSLPLRAQLSGRLMSAAGTPVAGAQVLAQGLGAGGVSMLGGAAPEAVLPQATTDADGRFALRLDPGDYDLEFVPVVGTQPRFSVENRRILSEDVELGYVRLPRPTLGKVLVLGPDGYPVAGASVRVFQLPDPQPSCELMLPCSTRARLRAVISTAANGRAQFLLPDVPSPAAP